jgi:hypothetical protein
VSAIVDIVSPFGKVSTKPDQAQLPGLIDPMAVAGRAVK